MTDALIEVLDGLGPDLASISPKTHGVPIDVWLMRETAKMMAQVHEDVRAGRIKPAEAIAPPPAEPLKFGESRQQSRRAGVHSKDSRKR